MKRCSFFRKLFPDPATVGKANIPSCQKKFN